MRWRWQYRADRVRSIRRDEIRRYMQMDYTMMIAVIGCVTGVASLLIETAQFIGGRRKARFDTFDQLNNFIYRKRSARRRFAAGMQSRALLLKSESYEYRRQVYSDTRCVYEKTW